MPGSAHQAAADPQRWVVVDGEGSVREVQDRVWVALTSRLGPLQPAPEAP